MGAKPPEREGECIYIELFSIFFYYSRALSSKTQSTSSLHGDEYEAGRPSTSETSKAERRSLESVGQENTVVQQAQTNAVPVPSAAPAQESRDNENRAEPTNQVESSVPGCTINTTSVHEDSSSRDMTKLDPVLRDLQSASSHEKLTDSGIETAGEDRTNSTGGWQDVTEFGWTLRGQELSVVNCTVSAAQIVFPISTSRLGRLELVLES
ncbi:unnamed protein product [Echinostoma caproni]|uniref:Uncharacterized protein n=1 Tax=Echinostoma caproni TaxID=27848 RepID=A0A183A8H6_9TREM|nr:unnamed protein product [Echinostoma caproni]